MKQETVLRISRILLRVTVVIVAFASILPLVFWSYIPDTIPTHYNFMGKADAWGDKGILFLLIFLALILLGIMSIAAYFVKTNGTSMYAKEEEKQSYPIMYPAIIWLNFTVAFLFSYIIIVCATGRDSLGVWFTPVMVISMCLPIGWIIYKRSRLQSETQKGVQKEQEKTAQGVVWKSRVDIWLALILIGSIGSVYFMTIKELIFGEVDWVLIGTSVFLGIIIFPLMSIKYVFYKDYLKISCGIYGVERIPYASITGMKKTYNPISSAALSIRRLEIRYNINGHEHMTLISPKNRDAFMQEIQKRKEQLS